MSDVRAFGSRFRLLFMVGYFNSALGDYQLKVKVFSSQEGGGIQLVSTNWAIGGTPEAP